MARVTAWGLAALPAGIWPHLPSWPGGWGAGGPVGCKLSSLSFRALGQGVAPCPPPWPSLGGWRSQGFFLSHTSFPWGGPALSCSRLWFPGHCPPAGVKMQRAASLPVYPSGGNGWRGLRGGALALLEKYNMVGKGTRNDKEENPMLRGNAPGKRLAGGADNGASFLPMKKMGKFLSAASQGGCWLRAESVLAAPGLSQQRFSL